MNKQTLVLRAAECAVKEMMEQQSTSCLVAECKDSNHAKIHKIRWTDVLIGLREMEGGE